MKKIKQLIKENPNDATLGEAIRELYDIPEENEKINFVCELCKHINTDVCIGCPAPYDP